MPWNFKVVNLLLKSKKKVLDVLRGLHHGLQIVSFIGKHIQPLTGVQDRLCTWLKTRKSKCLLTSVLEAGE